jgi:hypothetical protein
MTLNVTKMDDLKEIDKFSCPICFDEGREHIHEGAESFIVHLLGHLNDVLKWTGENWIPKT